MRLDYVGTIIVNCGEQSIKVQNAIANSLNEAGYDFTSRKDDRFAENAIRISLYAGKRNDNNG